MNRFILTPPASRDLEQIKNFLVGQAGASIARRVLSEIRSALQLIGSRPAAGHSRNDLTDRPLKFWPIYSYLIVYNPETQPIQIIRVLHGMRNVEEILD